LEKCLNVYLFWEKCKMGLGAFCGVRKKKDWKQTKKNPKAKMKTSSLPRKAMSIASSSFSSSVPSCLAPLAALGDPPQPQPSSESSLKPKPR
jgi:hypothetical protein